MTTTKTMDEACRITHGASIHNLYIMVPHRMPPSLRSAEAFPPDEDDGDSRVGGDHDMHSTVPLTEAMNYDGHQKFAVRRIAEAALAEIRGAIDTPTGG